MMKYMIDRLKGKSFYLYEFNTKNPYKSSKKSSCILLMIEYTEEFFQIQVKSDLNKSKDVIAHRYYHGLRMTYSISWNFKSLKQSTKWYNMH